VVINQRKAIVDTLLVCIYELRNFTAQAWPTRCGGLPMVVTSMAQIRFAGLRNNGGREPQPWCTVPQVWSVPS
jgi:hypothetical protein